MKPLSPTWLVGALSLSTLVSQAIADEPIMVELRLRKSNNVMKRGVNGGPALEVRDASIIADGGFSSFLAERANNSTLSQIEEILHKRQTNKDKDDKGKCKKAPKCYYDSMVYSEKTQKCEDCPRGEKASKDGTKCEKPKTEKEQKEQGKCPDGKKLDPSVKGQDELTENPKCVDKDSKDCPEGQSMSTPRKDKKAECAPDDEPDKKCDKEKDTELFKEVGPDGKMKSTCRSTKEKEDKKNKMIKDKQEPIKTKYAHKDNKERERQKRIRARRGACFALGAMSFIPADDMKAITDEEIAGMQEPGYDGDDPIPGEELKDHMITLGKPAQVSVPYTEEAGLGGIVKAIIKIFKSAASVSKAATLFKNAAKSTGGARMKDLRKPFINKAAGKKAVEAAKKSDRIKKIAKSDTFLDCVAMGAITAAELGSQVNGKKRDEGEKGGKRQIKDIKAGDYTLSIDLDAKEEDQHPQSAFSNNAVVLVADKSEDAGSDNTPDIVWQTWADNYHRGDRLNYESCQSLEGTSADKSWSLVQVWGGCCNFYTGYKCEADKGLFAMTNREDGNLKGSSNDAISSFWCTFDEGCKGAPGI